MHGALRFEEEYESPDACLLTLDAGRSMAVSLRTKYVAKYRIWPGALVQRPLDTSQRE